MKTSPIPFPPLALFALLAGISLIHAPLRGQEWTRFHGPNGSGISEDDSFPAKWTEKDYAWKVKLPGIGHSSPVIWGDRVFLLSADPKSATRYIVCLSATDGKRQWVKEFTSDTHHLHSRSSYASCTPAVDADFVYVAWSTPKKTTLMALRHNGEKEWIVPRPVGF